VVERADLHITSKLWNDKHAPDKAKAAFDQTLKVG
jgi:diketogulonate reductase-like aldo/keto reductase